jgi:trigger factor
VTEAKRPIRPELDDAFAQSVGEFSSLHDLRSRVRADLEAEAGREADRAVRGQLLQQIVEANPFDVPSSMVDEYLARLVPQREGEDPERVSDVRRAAFPAAVEGIKRMLVVEKVAETEALNATPDEVGTRLEEIAARLGRSVSDVRARFSKSGRMDEIEHEITEDKVFQYLATLSSIE